MDGYKLALEKAWRFSTNRAANSFASNCTQIFSIVDSNFAIASSSLSTCGAP